ncbi:MAG TPA: presqualene diphosphate synthase HpnD [Pseudolabrys sp.]|nr:presqualene diphosphate synthase HpnD [Pseudolabrys sp.]
MSATAKTQPAAAQRASGSSFYLAMRIMPKPQREAMYEIYSFCRRVDDIADDGGPRNVRHKQLQQWRADIDALYAGKPPTHLSDLARAVRTFDLQREDFLAVIDGMEMDVVADIRAPDFATFDLYCDRVASAVGRLSVRVFGMEKEAGLALAHHLGRALQMTNILRDLDEDAAIGRLYLPREALGEAGIAGNDPTTVLSSPAIDKACAPVVARIERHFTEADKIMVASPRRAVKAPRIMGCAYRIMFDRMRERGWQAPRPRVRLARRQFLWILLRYAIV